MFKSDLPSYNWHNTGSWDLQIVSSHRLLLLHYILSWQSIIDQQYISHLPQYMTHLMQCKQDATHIWEFATSSLCDLFFIGGVCFAKTEEWER